MIRIAGWSVAAAMSLAASGCAQEAAETNETAATEADTAYAAPFDEAEHREFDFWIGEWRAEWFRATVEGLDSFAPILEMRHRVFPILDGKALVELAEPFEGADEAGSLRGFSIRYRDPETGGWSMAQHWPSPGNAGVGFTDQLTGGPMEHGRATVYSVEAQSEPDAPRHRRYTFSDIAPERFRWDRALTDDAGQTWATNLKMHFHRVADAAPARAPGTPWFGYGSGETCSGEPHGAFDGLEGVWTGTVTDADGEESPASLEAGRMLDGCAVAGFITSGEREAFFGFSYAPRFESWIAISLADAPEARHRYAVADAGGEGAVFEEDPGLTIASRTARYYGVDGGPARRRMVWRTIAEDELAFDIETREDGDSAWTISASYRLEPAE